MSRLNTAIKVNSIIKSQRSAIRNTIPRMMNESMISANGDAAKARISVSFLGESASLLTVKNWNINMVTNPGDLVKSPDTEFVYVYSGKDVMTHSNPLYFPGSVGVYYWTIVPEVKNGFKVYPDINGIIVAVKKDEVWWNTTKTQKFYWKGADNANCVWPPVVGNEWGVVD